MIHHSVSVPVTSPWCNENAANCEGNCSGKYCDGTATPSATPSAKPSAPSAVPTAVPTDAPTTNMCYNAACGCPGSGSAAAAWCGTQATWPEITSPWCNEKAANCEGSCNGKFCA